MNKKSYQFGLTPRDLYLITEQQTNIERAIKSFEDDHCGTSEIPFVGLEYYSRININLLDLFKQRRSKNDLKKTIKIAQKFIDTVSQDNSQKAE